MFTIIKNAIELYEPQATVILASENTANEISNRVLDVENPFCIVDVQIKSNMVLNANSLNTIENSRCLIYLLVKDKEDSSDS